MLTALIDGRSFLAQNGSSWGKVVKLTVHRGKELRPCSSWGLNVVSFFF